MPDYRLCSNEGDGSAVQYCCDSHCLWEFSIRSLLGFAVLCVLSSFAIISLGKRQMVTFLMACHCYPGSGVVLDCIDS